MLIVPPAGWNTVRPSFSFLAAGGASSPTITIPGTPTAGDLCVIFNWCRNAFPGTVPSGFTALQTNGSAGVGGGIISAKKLDGTETTVTGLNGDNDELWIVATFRPTGPFASFAWNSGNGENVNSANPASQNIVALGATVPVILLGQMCASGTISPRSISPAMDELNSHSNVNQYAHYKIYNPGDTPASHTYDMDDEGNQIVIQSGYLSFT
jgi:hypothetical protein